jgi:hypothetical protein
VARRNRDWDRDYLTRKKQLPKNLQLELDLLEERIVTDPDRTYQRRYLEDGVIVDESGFDETGFELTFLDEGDTFRFLGFTLEEGP